MERLFNGVQRCLTVLPHKFIPGVPCTLRCILSFWISAALGVFPREKRALARFSRISIPIICGIIYPLYIIYYYISVRTDLYGGRIDSFVCRILILRCRFTAHSGFTRRIFLEVDPFLVFIGVCTLVRRTGSGVKSYVFVCRQTK